MDLVGTIGQTEDTSPREEMGQRSRARETHGNTVVKNMYVCSMSVIHGILKIAHM